MSKHYKSYGCKPIFSITSKVMTPALKTMGWHVPDIILQWHKIVGPHWSKHITPLQIHFFKDSKKNGVLHLKTTVAGKQYILYAADLLIEKINQYYGYKAIASVRSIMWPKAPKPLPLTTDPQVSNPAPYPDSLKKIQDSGLRQVMEDFWVCFTNKY